MKTLTDLGARASMDIPPEIIFVGKDEMTVLGEKARTIAEVTQILTENRIVSVEIRPQPGAGYELVGVAIYGANRSGARIEHIGPLAVPECK